jgi:hypothetical protein
MRSKPKYGVQFIGYSADIVARKKGGDVNYAKLDFVSRFASLNAGGGLVMARDLGPFVNDLPKIVVELEELLKELASSLGGKACRGPYSVSLMPEQLSGARWIEITISSEAEICEIHIPQGVHFRQFIRNVVKRFAEVEPVMEQAEIIGNSINRRPYEEYIKEIAETGLARVEYYGFALFIDGHLRLFPERRTALVQSQDDNTTFLVRPLENGPRSLN